MRRGDRIPALVGAVIGLAVSGYVLVYAPMRHNYRECGKVTLCQTPNGGNRD